MLFWVEGALVAQYNFYNSFGEVLNDHSGNEKWAINGLSEANNRYNVDFIDQRGIYAESEFQRVESPPNTFAPSSSVDVGEDFTVMCMTFEFQNGGR